MRGEQGCQLERLGPLLYSGKMGAVCHLCPELESHPFFPNWGLHSLREPQRLRELDSSADLMQNFEKLAVRECTFWEITFPIVMISPLNLLDLFQYPFCLTQSFIYLFYFRERKGERVRNTNGREKHGSVVSHMSPNWDWIHNLVMCPGWELNMQHFGVGHDAPTNWAI